MIALMIQFALTIIASAVVVTLAVNYLFSKGESLIDKRRAKTHH